MSIAALLDILMEEYKDYRNFCLTACHAYFLSSSRSALSAQILAVLQELKIYIHVSDAIQEGSFLL